MEEPGWKMPQQGFWRLRAWQGADEMASAIYNGCRTRETPLWLQDQVCRSGLSVPSNISEGYTRGSINDYLHFLDVARSSLAESEYQVYFLHKHQHISDVTRNEIAALQYKTHNISEVSPEYGEGAADELLPPSSFPLPGERGG